MRFVGFKVFLVVGLAGLLGSFIRLLIVASATPFLPAAILAANVIGSAYAAFWIARIDRRGSSSQSALLHGVGVAGGLTTFAGFIEVLVGYLSVEDYFTAFVWIAATLLLSGAAFFVTIRTVKIRN